MGCANSSAIVELEEVVPVGRSNEKSVKNVKRNVSKGNGELVARVEPFKVGSMSDYQFKGKLGQGSFATVHKASSSKLGMVAVKVTDLSDEDNDEWDVKRLSAEKLHNISEEVAILTQVSGKTNVIEFYGSFTEASLNFVVMEKCDCSLLQAMDRLPAITEATTSKMLKEMLNGLAAVHAAGVVHRDVKPDNFLCVGVRMTVKLCDFGLAAVLPRNGAGLSGNFGTPPFMSPEMLQGKPYNEKADVWAVGVIVYSLFYGRFPYEPTERNGKAMKEAIRSGIPFPTFRTPANMPSAEKVTEGARHLAIDLLSRNPEKRSSADAASRHSFFATAGKTNLAPMLESARSFGAFCVVARNDPSLKNEVDLRIETLQQKRREMAAKVQALNDAAVKVYLPMMSDEEDDCSTQVASSCDLTPRSPASSHPSSGSEETGVDGN